jgi:hypothetical protein
MDNSCFIASPFPEAAQHASPQIGLFTMLLPYFGHKIIGSQISIISQATQLFGRDAVHANTSRAGLTTNTGCSEKAAVTRLNLLMSKKKPL